MVDVFDEVDEQVRSDQFRAMLFKYGPGVLGGLAAILLVALVWWGYTSMREAAADKASTAYSAGMEKLAQGDAKGAFAQFGAAADASSGVYKSLALQQQGSIRLEENNTAAAVDLFDKAAKASPDQMVGDLARLKSAQALMDTASYADEEARLKPLTDANRPLSALAREALAFAKLQAGKLKEARADFVVLSLLSSASDPVRQRARVAIALIDDGSAAQLNATVKASQSLAANPLFPEGPPSAGPAPTTAPQPEPAQ